MAPDAKAACVATIRRALELTEDHEHIVFVMGTAFSCSETSTLLTAIQAGFGAQATCVPLRFFAVEAGCRRRTVAIYTHIYT